VKTHEIIKTALAKLGGSGSGNFGHAGRPGKRGGSASRTGVIALQGMVGWGAVPKETQAMLLGDIGKVPPEHLEGCSFSIGHDPDSRITYKGWDRELIINPDNVQKDDLVHDVGHHVEQTMLTRVQKDAIAKERSSSISTDIAPEFLKWDDETFSELYKLYLLGRPSQDFPMINGVIKAVVESPPPPKPRGELGYKVVH